jgi:UDP-glucose 4-epimerase
MALHGKRVLITGGAGFIGSTLARRLVDDNRVVLYDNLTRDALRHTDLAAHPNVESVNGDILDAAALAQAAEGATHIVHMAAIAGVDSVLKSPVRTMRVNLLGTANVLDAAAANRDTLERFIDFSTSEVFGRHAYKVEETHETSGGSVGEARWTYAVSKLAGEYLAHSYFDEMGLPTAVIRPFNIYGPNQVGSGAIHHFTVRGLAGDELIIHGDGSQIRAWCYIDDIVAAILEILESPNAIGQAFNIGNPRSVCTTYDLALRIRRLTGNRSPLVFRPLHYSDVEIRIPDITKSRELLAWEPQVDLDEGLERTLEWYKSRSGTP